METCLWMKDFFHVSKKVPFHQSEGNGKRWKLVFDAERSEEDPSGS